MIRGAQIGTRVRVLSGGRPRCDGYSSEIVGGGKNLTASWDFSLGNTGRVIRVYRRNSFVLYYVKPDKEFGFGEHSFVPRDLERIGS